MTRQQVEELAAQFGAASDLACRLGLEFSLLELDEAPSTGAWSAVDNLMHLTLASQAFVPRMSKTLGKLKNAGHRTDGPTRADWVGRCYAWALEPPVHLKMKAPRPFVPPPGTPAGDALPAFLAEQARVLELVERSAGLDLAALTVPSPISRHIRYNVYSAFCIVAAHERRHLWQARRAALAARERSTPRA